MTEETAEELVIIDSIQDCLGCAMNDGHISVRKASDCILRKLENEIEVADLHELISLIARAFMSFEKDMREKLIDDGYDEITIRSFHRNIHRIREILRDKLSKMADDETIIEVTPEITW